MQALFAFLALALGATNVYRWVDADGQAHFSDQPQAGAERITINVSPPAQSTAQSAGASATGSTQAPEDETPSPGYQSLTITSPAGEEVLWNIGGELDVVAAVQPALQPGHVLQFFLDGQMVAAAPGANRARFTEVFRGEHSLRVEVADAAGRTLVSSPTTQFFVRQTAQNPARP